MSSSRSAAACAPGTRPRLGLGESTAIATMETLATTHGTSPGEVPATLGSPGLLGALVIRHTRKGLLTAAIRRAGRVLFPAQA